MTDVIAKSKYWLFRQNNSGGDFDIDDGAGIGPRVWIEAMNEQQAEGRALEIGIYFDGVKGGRDCKCCGDRWYRPGKNGRDAVELNEESDFHWGPTVYVHRLDGSIERMTKTKSPK